MAADTEIRLLGGVQVRRDGTEVPLGGRRVRALMVLLALDAGRTVTVERLSRGIWDDDPPERVKGSLQTCVSRLRRVLGEDAIHTEATGYRLRVPRQRVDALRFRDGAARARDSDSARAEREILDEALAAWAGAPFGEQLSTWIERYEKPRLVEEHLQAVERRIDLDLAARKHAECAGELHSLVQEHPLRETLWVRLLRALAGAGRSAEALEQYDVVRTVLATELGADPGPELQEVYVDLLRPPEPPRDSAGDTSSHVSVPRQLPASMRGFTGRERELAALDGAAESGRVLVVHGPGGAGKTSLVLAWARRVADDFPDGQLFVDLRGFGPSEPFPPGAAVDLMLRSLGVPGTDVPPDLESRSAMLRSVLADRRCLVVLDNAREAAQVRPLLPGGASVVIVTSRSQFRSLAAREGAVRVALGQMAPEESVAMLRARLDASVDDVLVTELSELCGHLPVALSIAAERCGRDPAGLAQVVDELRDEAGRLDRLATGDDDLTDVRAVLDWTHRSLDPESARMFRLLGLYPDNTVSRLAAIALGGTSWSRGRELLDRLADLHLLEPLPDGWFVIHDLVRSFARRCVDTDSPTGERDAAWERLVSWYVATASNARRSLGEPATRMPDLPLADGVQPQELSPGSEGVAWFAEHRSALRTLLVHAERRGEHAAVVRIASCVAAYLECVCAEAEQQEMVARADRAARAAGDPATEAVAANRMGTMHGRLEDYDAAMPHLLRARRLFLSIDDTTGELRVMSNIAQVLERRGRMSEAIAMHEDVLARSRALGDPNEVGGALRQLACCLNNGGQHERARRYASEAVGISITEDDQVALGLSYDFRAAAELGLGLHAASRDSYRSALAVYLEVGDIRNAAETLEEIGLVEQDAGWYDDAAASWRRAVELLAGLGHGDVDEWIRRLEQMAERPDSGHGLG